MHDVDMGHEFSNQNQMIYVSSTLINRIQNFKLTSDLSILTMQRVHIIDCLIHGFVKSKFDLDLLKSYRHYNHS